MYDGTWASGPPPQEVVDFEVTLATGWTWQQLQDTPAYWRRCMVDLLNIRRTAENERHERDMAKARSGG